MRVRFLQSISGLTLTLLVGTASAHVELMTPPPRLAGQAGGNALKQKPCGQSSNMRTEMVTTFKPGEVIEIKIKEYIDHPGYFAVAFDADGDNDFPFPIANMDDVDEATHDPKALFPLNDKVLGFHLDTADGNCAASADKTCTISVKLPNIQCQNCTLQVTQFMTDKLGDGNDNEYYYQCADIKLEGELMSGGGGGGGAGGGGVGGSAGAPNSGGGATAGGSGGGGAGTSAGAPSGGGISGSTSTAGTAPATAGTMTGGTSSVPPAAEDDGGCSIAPGAGARTRFTLLAGSLLLGLGWLARRRNRPQ
jgi:hypothetical protein